MRDHIVVSFGQIIAGQRKVGGPILAHLLGGQCRTGL